MKITQSDFLPPGFTEILRRGAPEVNGIAWFTTDTGLKVVRSVDTTEHGTLLHLSISHPERYPTWEELKACKAYFFGDAKDAVMVFPREALWVNIHANCFHLWELPKIPGRSGRWELM